MKNKFKTYEGNILILLSALMFGSYGVFSKYLSNYDLFYQTYVKCILIVLLLAVIGITKKQYTQIAREDFKWFAIVLTSTCFTIVPIMYAFRYLELGTASFLFYASYTIFTYLFGISFFKEKLTYVKVISFVLALIGLILIFSLKLSGLLVFPILGAIFNGLMSSAETTFSKKISGKYSNIQIVTLVYLAIAITHLIISFVIGEHQDISLITVSWLPFILYTLASIIGFAAVVAGYKYVDPSIGAILGLMEIVFSVLFGFILFSENPDIKTLIAAGLPSAVDYFKTNRGGKNYQTS